MLKYAHFAAEIKAATENIGNVALGAAVRARIALEDPTPTPYDIHGLPDPSGIDVTNEVRDKAANIINQGAPGLLIQYIREAATSVTTISRSGSKTRCSEKILRGAPIGVMVAFVDNEELLVGHSKYNQATVKNEDGETVLVKGKPEQVEKLVFTKRDAINTAVLRALTGNISVAGAPFKIAEALPVFMDRVERYFKAIVFNKNMVSRTNENNTVGYA